MSGSGDPPGHLGRPRIGLGLEYAWPSDDGGEHHSHQTRENCFGSTLDDVQSGPAVDAGFTSLRFRPVETGSSSSIASVPSGRFASTNMRCAQRLPAALLT